MQPEGSERMAGFASTNGLAGRLAGASFPPAGAIICSDLAREAQRGEIVR